MDDTGPHNMGHVLVLMQLTIPLGKGSQKDKHKEAQNCALLHTLMTVSLKTMRLVKGALTGKAVCMHECACERCV